MELKEKIIYTALLAFVVSGLLAIVVLLHAQATTHPLPTATPVVTYQPPPGYLGAVPPVLLPNGRVLVTPVPNPTMDAYLDAHAICGAPPDLYPCSSLPHTLVPTHVAILHPTTSITFPRIASDN